MLSKLYGWLAGSSHIILRPCIYGPAFRRQFFCFGEIIIIIIIHKWAPIYGYVHLKYVFCKLSCEQPDKFMKIKQLLPISISIWMYK